ncbi:unnamed protein product [Phaeothamnion confervicola]
MVTRNRSEGSGSPQWWDDLPAQMRTRFSQPLVREPEPARPEGDERAGGAPPSLDRGELISNLSLLAGLFAAVAVGSIVFLLAAIYFVCG